MPTLPADTTLDDPVAVAKAFNDFSGVKSYLSRDVDGRVIRIDSFSKVFGPGIRLVSQTELGRAVWSVGNDDDRAG